MNVIDNVIQEIKRQLVFENSQQVLNLSKALYWLRLADKVQIEILSNVNSVTSDGKGNFIG